MKKKTKGESYLSSGPKRLQFGEVISSRTGAPSNPAKEGDKLYSKGVPLPEGSRTDKSSRIVYDKDGNRIGKRIAASTPKYVPDAKNAGSRSKQAADYINRSRGKTKAEMERERRERERNATTSTVSARERKQNQAQGSGGKDREGNVKEPRDLRTGKSGSDAANRTFPKKQTPKKPAPVAPIQKKGPGPIDSGVKKPGLQTPKTPQKPVEAEKRSSTGNKRADRIMDRAEKRAGKIIDRRAKKDNRKERGEAIKSAKTEARNTIRQAKGKPVKRMVGGLGAASMVGGLAGQAMQNSENPTLQKIGQGLSTVSNVAGAVSGGPAGLLKKAAAGAGGAAPAAAKYGKMKGKKGVMKYRSGGTKPDYLDVDKDGNKTESMKKALKDRRSRGGYGKKR